MIIIPKYLLYNYMEPFERDSTIGYCQPSVSGYLRDHLNHKILKDQRNHKVGTIYAKPQLELSDIETLDTQCCG